LSISVLKRKAERKKGWLEAGRVEAEKNSEMPQPVFRKYSTSPSQHNSEPDLEEKERRDQGADRGLNGRSLSLEIGERRGPGFWGKERPGVLVNGLGDMRRDRVRGLGHGAPPLQ
jgi:hypothetical protein